MRLRAIILISIISILTISLFAQDKASLGEDIIVKEDEVQDNIISFGGNVLVEGKIRESVVVFGGRVEIKGEIGEAVVGFGSQVKLYSSAVIKGDVVVLGGHLEKEPGSVIQGDTVYFGTAESLTKLFSQFFRGLFSLSFVPIVLILKALNIFIWFLLAIILVAIFPKQISYASSQVDKNFWSIVGVGLLSLIIFIGLVLVSALLSILLIGIPILILLLFGGFIIQFYGRVVLFYFFGEKLSLAFNWRSASEIAVVILGVILVSLIRFIPVIGLLFALCLSVIGWGVVIKTRFGTR